MWPVVLTRRSVSSSSPRPRNHSVLRLPSRFCIWIGVVLILLDELGGAEVFAVERLAAADAGAGGEAQAGEAVRAAAGRAADRLGQFFADQPRDVPACALVVDPGGVGVEVVHQGDQLEGQLALRVAGFLFGFDQVLDRELLVADADRIFGRDLALGEHRQELAHVTLQADALLGAELVFGRQRRAASCPSSGRL